MVKVQLLEEIHARGALASHFTLHFHTWHSQHAFDEAPLNGNVWEVAGNQYGGGQGKQGHRLSDSLGELLGLVPVGEKTHVEHQQFEHGSECV